MKCHVDKMTCRQFNVVDPFAKPKMAENNIHSANLAIFFVFFRRTGNLRLLIIRFNCRKKSVVPFPELIRHDQKSFFHLKNDFSTKKLKAMAGLHSFGCCSLFGLRQVLLRVSISPTFYKQLLRQNPFAQNLQTKILSTEKLCKKN